MGSLLQGVGSSLTLYKHDLEAFHQVYGDKPEEIDISFLAVNAEQVLQGCLDERYESLDAAGNVRCFGCGNGSPAHCLGEGDAIENDLCYGIHCPIFAHGECSIVGRLRVILPFTRSRHCWELVIPDASALAEFKGAIELAQNLFPHQGGGNFLSRVFKIRLEPGQRLPSGRRVFTLRLYLQEPVAS